jgi:hypothetical protein
MQLGVAGVIPQSLQLQAQVTIASQGHVTIGESARNHVRVDHCVSAVRVVEVPL